MTDIYALVSALDLHRQEIARQCRAALEDGELAESPISRFYPSFGTPFQRRDAKRRFWEHSSREACATLREHLR